MELSRRKWPTLDIGPLETWRKRDIVEAFLKRSLVGRSTGELTSLANESSGTQRQQQQQQGSAAFLTGVDVTDDRGISFSADSDAGRASLAVGGLVLFPSMIESILLRWGGYRWWCCAWVEGECRNRMVPKVTGIDIGSSPTLRIRTPGFQSSGVLRNIGDQRFPPSSQCVPVGAKLSHRKPHGTPGWLRGAALTSFVY